MRDELVHRDSIITLQIVNKSNWLTYNLHNNNMKRAFAVYMRKSMEIWSGGLQDDVEQAN